MGERIAYIDVLRGIAVLAIFVVNIKVMMAPFAYYENLSLWSTSMDQTIAIVQRYLIHDKWRGVFTLLYGAGLLVFADRLRVQGAGRAVLVKRNLWLMLFGAIHLFGIWVGDILLLYGCAGLATLLFTEMKTTKLMMFSCLFLLLGGAWMAGLSSMMSSSPEFTAELKPLFWLPTEESLDAEATAILGSLQEQISARFINGIGVFFGFVLAGGLYPFTIGLMLLGMGLFRVGLLRGTWSPCVTLPVATVFLAAAWWLDGYQIAALRASEFAFTTQNHIQALTNLDGVLGAIGYAALVSSLLGMGLKLSPLAAAGRMAFTNYILCSLVGTTLAAGHGMALYGRLSLAEMIGIVAAVTAFILVFSPLWLRFFRQGPLEWAWRSLLHGRRQPLLRTVRNGSD
ncbi:MAG: DUF418 domain-containing protein [Pseudomonadota bacterium]